MCEDWKAGKRIESCKSDGWMDGYYVPEIDYQKEVEEAMDRL